MGTDIHQEGNAEDVGDELLGCAMHAGGSAPTDITQTHRSGYYETMYVHTMIHMHMHIYLQTSRRPIGAGTAAL